MSNPLVPDVAASSSPFQGAPQEIASDSLTTTSAAPGNMVAAEEASTSKMHTEDNESNGLKESVKQRLRRRSKRVDKTQQNRSQSFFAEPGASTNSEVQNNSSLPDDQEKEVTTWLIRPVARRPVPVGQATSNTPTAPRQEAAATTSNWSNVPVQKKRNTQRSAASLARKYKKPSWYHSVAANNQLGSIHEDAFLLSDTLSQDEKQQETLLVAASQPTLVAPIAGKVTPVQQAKHDLLQALNATAGDSSTPAFRSALQALMLQYDSSHFNPRKPVPRHAKACAANQFEGIGISAGKPTFPGCLGRNPRTGDPMYKLGTMSFDMFCPTQLVVSVQGSFVLIDTVDGRNSRGVKNVPKELLADVRFGRSPVRTYDIVTPFTIEPWQPEFGENSPNKGVAQPVQGVMTTYGFLLPFPTKHRFSVWFTGGSLEVDGHKNEKWIQIFDKAAAPKRTAAEYGKVLAAKLLMGAAASNGEMDQDGKLTYSLSRPKASHVDLLYLDKTLQVLRSSSGTVYVHVRLPGSEVVHESARSDELLPVPKDPLQRSNSNTSSEEYQPKGSDDGIDYQQLERISDSSSKAREPSIRRVASDSNLQDYPLHEHDAASDARLQELQSYVVASSPTERQKSNLKRSSSYGNMESVGSNIPINLDRNAWMALPTPKGRQPKISRKDLKRAWMRHRRVASDPSALLLCPDEPNLKSDDMTEICSTDSEDDLQSKSTTQPLASKSKLRKAVSFSSLEIRNYNVTVGDNPACSRGPAVSLDWTYDQDSKKMPIPDREAGKRNRKNFHMGPMERSLMLRRQFGVGNSEIRSASAEAEKVKAQREFTSKYRSTPAAMKVEGAIESVQRRAKRIVNRLKPKDGDPKRGIAGVA